MQRPVAAEALGGGRRRRGWSERATTGSKRRISGPYYGRLVLAGFAFTHHIRPVPWPCQRAEALFQRQPTNASLGHGTARHSIQRDISQPPAGCKTSRPNSSASRGLRCAACSLIPYRRPLLMPLHDFIPIPTRTRCRGPLLRRPRFAAGRRVRVEGLSWRRSPKVCGRGRRFLSVTTSTTSTMSIQTIFISADAKVPQISAQRVAASPIADTSPRTRVRSWSPLLVR